MPSGIVDAHNHLWIAPLEGTADDVPVLDQFDALETELTAFRKIGGAAALDSQPGAGCGRNGHMLENLSISSGIEIFACTGFHRRRYYPRGYYLFEVDPGTARAHFLSEVEVGLEECVASQHPVKAGYIKIAAGTSLADTPQGLMEAAVSAAAETDALLSVHTEQGACAEQLLSALLKLGMRAERIMLCHMDKLADPGLHRALAQSGALLEYDTFFRPKYHPETNAWPLLRSMREHGFLGAIAIGTDMADNTSWKSMGGEIGLPGMHTGLALRLHQEGFSAEEIKAVQGRNLLARLQRPVGAETRSSHHA